MKNKPLVIYLTIITILSGGFIVLMKLLGQKGNYLAALYMIVPAITAIITRAFFYDQKFKDANLRFGKVKDYVKYWAIGLGISLLSFIIFTLMGAIKWDFSGQVFLNQLTQQFALTGKNINDLPAGFTPEIMLVLFFIGGLTIFNILPGIITGFGEEFGWRGFMFPQLYKIKPWVAFVIGGLIWYAWHMPLVFVFPQAQTFTILQTIMNTAILSVGSICTYTFLAYVYIKSENIFVVSVTHITLNNAARSIAYFVIVQNQFMANVSLTITMLIVVAVLCFSKEWEVFENYFNNRKIENLEQTPV
jgi:uncharacterized protein